MIPPIDEESGILPPGIHEATSWKEIEDHFGWNDHRRSLLSGLHALLDNLRDAGCRRIWLNGSFVTAKDHPGDFDGLWSVEGVDFARVDPVLFETQWPRFAQKAKYQGEFFPVHPATDQFLTWVDFFETHKETGRKKGIVGFNPGGSI